MLLHRFSKTRRDHATESAADYAEMIDDLHAETGEARVVDLAGRLGLSHVTVLRTLQRLERDGYLVSRPYRGVFLTEKGTTAASEARRRHRVVRDVLVAVGVPPEVAEDDAEGMEHHVSDVALDAMTRFLQANASPAAAGARARSGSSAP